MSTLILVRHAESEKNALRIVNHDFTKPYSLTEKGRGQAQEAGAALKDISFTHVITSRYARTQETAKLILGQHEMHVDIDPRLDEIHNGVLEGETIAAYRAHVHDRVLQTPEGGETWSALKSRLQSFLDDAKKMDGTILVVSHGHPVAVMRGLIGGWDDHTMDVAIPKHSEFFRYEFPDG